MNASRTLTAWGLNTRPSITHCVWRSLMHRLGVVCWHSMAQSPVLLQACSCPFYHPPPLPPLPRSLPPMQATEEITIHSILQHGGLSPPLAVVVRPSSLSIVYQGGGLPLIEEPEERLYPAAPEHFLLPVPAAGHIQWMRMARSHSSGTKLLVGDSP